MTRSENLTASLLSTIIHPTLFDTMDQQCRCTAGIDEIEISFRSELSSAFGLGPSCVTWLPAGATINKVGVSCRHDEDSTQGPWSEIPTRDAENFTLGTVESAQFKLQTMRY